MHAIEVNGLGKTYAGEIHAVKEIDFDVAPGEVFGLLGPNGAGKSTTVGMLTTTVAPTRGTARVGGFDVAADPRGARSISSVVFQDAAVDRGLTGRRNLELHAQLWGIGPRAAASTIDELVEAFGLGGLIGRPVAGYSGGERRRLEIARALVSQPRLLFLDEPTVGLDPRIRHELLDVIGGLRDRGETTIVLTTHYLDEAERLCDRVAIMHAGEIAALGTPGALRAAVGNGILELRVAGDVAATLGVLRSHGVAGADAFAVGSTLTIPLHDVRSADALAAVHGLELDTAAVGTREPTLDDVYLSLTGDRLAQAA